MGQAIGIAASDSRRSVSGMADSNASAVQELLRDFFTRIIEHVDELVDGLTDELSTYRPTPDANSIAWLIWHSARVQDAQVADIAGVDQVWTGEGWVDRFALDLPRDDTGYGHSAEDVGKVHVVMVRDDIEFEISEADQHDLTRPARPGPVPGGDPDFPSRRSLPVEPRVVDDVANAGRMPAS